MTQTLNPKLAYARLGLPLGASKADVKAAYRKLAKKCHPDVNLGNSKAAEELFKHIGAAFDFLTKFFASAAEESFSSKSSHPRDVSIAEAISRFNACAAKHDIQGAHCYEAILLNKVGEVPDLADLFLKKISNDHLFRHAGKLAFAIAKKEPKKYFATMKSYHIEKFTAADRVVLLSFANRNPRYARELSRDIPASKLALPEAGMLAARLREIALADIMSRPAWQRKDPKMKVRVDGTAAKPLFIDPYTAGMRRGAVIAKRGEAASWGVSTPRHGKSSDFTFY